MSIDDIRTVSSEVAAQPFIAGLCGATLGVRGMAGSTWLERVLNCFIGGICAHYGAPALIEWMHIEGPARSSAIAFAFGAFGLSVYLALVDAIKRIEWVNVLINLIEGFSTRRGGDK